MGVRGEAGTLGSADLGSLRRGFSLAYGIRDEHGYGYHAGLHGLPLPSYCVHTNDLFLPWHRAYLYFFERALQDLDRDANLPWWDWTSRASHTGGIPAGYERSRGASVNPLAAGPVTLSRGDLVAFRADARNRGSISSGSQPQTLRDPDPPDDLPREATVRRALSARTYGDFAAIMRDIHNAVHRWVGGAMTLLSVAAYDPLFWAHHAMIDRLWYLWQNATGTQPPAQLLNVALAPFRMTVRETLNIDNLGYGYAVRVIR